MIQVIAGAAFVGKGPRRRVITPDDGPVSLSKALEARFVKLGVAEYVDAKAPKKADESPVEDPPVDPPTDGGDEDSEDSGGVVDDDSDYEAMTIDELKAECDERGIKYAKRAGRDVLIGLLQTDDEPPAIKANGVES